MHGSRTSPIEVSDADLNPRAELQAEGLPSPVTPSDVEKAFDRLTKEAKLVGDPLLYPEIDGLEILAAKEFDEKELERVDQGLGPEPFEDNVSIHVNDNGDNTGWSIDSILYGN
ncbi:hypothetical protein VKT23_003037 [Stygiomarasmius scandens]|uniref:Tropomodulin n=1 Tax=Marasmiellus scandens TaxID=2682957 RepID=A0ABR1JYD2_9AGAR